MGENTGLEKKDYDIVRDLIEHSIKKTMTEVGENETKELTEKQNEILTKVLKVIELDNDIEESLEALIEYNKRQLIESEDIEALIEKQKLIEESIEAVPQTIIPSEILQPRDKITNKVLLGEIPYTGEEVLVGTESQGKNEMTVIVSLKVEGNEIRFTKGLTHYDIALQGAIGRLYMEGNRLISYTTLYRVLTGNMKARPTESNIKQLEESLLKSMSTLVYMDCSEEAGRYPNLQGFLPKWRNAAELQLGQMVNYNNKVEKDWIKILDTPILFDYAFRKKHISQIAMEVLNTPVNKNQDTLTLQYYLQDRINRIRGSKLSRNISMNSILNQIDYSTCSSKQAIKNKRNRATNNIFKILDHFKETEFIKNYKVNMNKLNKKQYQSITIIF